MKALIIILALVAVSFIGLLVYGGTRSDQPKRACERLPPPSKDGNVEVPEDWCPPSVTKATRSIQARFAPGLGLKPETAEIDISPQQDNFFSVPPVSDPDKRRIAKLTLVQGDSAIVEGPENAKQCLCRPKVPVAAQLRGDACSKEWQQEHERKGWICQSAGKWGAIPIGARGGQLKFDKGPTARVQVK